MSTEPIALPGGVVLPTITQATTTISKLRDVAHAVSMLIIAVAAAWAAMKPSEPPPAPVVPATAAPARAVPAPAVPAAQATVHVRDDVIMAGTVTTYDQFVDAVAASILAKQKPTNR